MNWKQEPIEAVFLKRYKRFFADIQIDSNIEVAHVPNTGSLKTVIHSGQKCWISPAADPDRKLKFTLEALQSPEGVWIGVNTSWPNRVVKEALEQKLISDWKKFNLIQPEFKISKETRLDFCLSQTSTGARHFIEVKNVTMKVNTFAQFPDAVTERGQKHLVELIKLVREGNTAEIVFTVQRNDCSAFQPADSVDPEYGRLLREASLAGVQISPYVIDIKPRGIFMTSKKLKVIL